MERIILTAEIAENAEKCMKKPKKHAFSEIFFSSAFSAISAVKVFCLESIAYGTE
jgi:hypothetical protein